MGFVSTGGRHSVPLNRSLNCHELCQLAGNRPSTGHNWHGLLHANEALPQKEQQAALQRDQQPALQGDQPIFSSRYPRDGFSSNEIQLLNAFTMSTLRQPAHEADR
eukprot:3061805-Amphidinium_carterae.1